MKKKTFAVIVVTVAVLLLVTGISFAFLVHLNQNDTEQRIDYSEDIEKEEKQTKEEMSTIVVESQNDETNHVLEEALLYALGKDRAYDASKALALLEDIAEENMDAQFMAGEMYLQGIGTEKNPEKAAEYIQKAVSNGNSSAYAIYAKMCFLGEGVILQDYENSSFLKPDGSPDRTTVVTIITRILERHGLEHRDTEQRIAGIVIYPKEYFCPLDHLTRKMEITEKTYSIHYYDSSWWTEEQKYAGKLAVRFRKCLPEKAAKRLAKAIAICHHRGCGSMLREFRRSLKK